jgi:hypothetical protein
LMAPRPSSRRFGLLRNGLGNQNLGLQ